MFAPASSPSTRRLRRLLSLILLPAVLLSLFAPAVPAEAQTLPPDFSNLGPACAHLAQVRSWTGTASVSHSGSLSHVFTDSFGQTTTYIASSNSNTSGSATMTPFRDGWSGWRGPLSGGGGLGESYSISHRQGTSVEELVSNGGLLRGSLAITVIDGPGCIIAVGISGFFPTTRTYREWTGRIETLVSEGGVNGSYQLVSFGSRDGTPTLAGSAMLPLNGRDRFTTFSTAAASGLGRVAQMSGGSLGSAGFTFSLVGQTDTPPPPPVELSDLTLQRQDRDGDQWFDLPAQASVGEGTRARIVAGIRNPGAQPATVRLTFRNTTTNQALAGCPAEVSVPPTGTGAPHPVTCDIATAGLAFSDNDLASYGTRHALRVGLTTTGGAEQTRETALNVRPRPIVLVPGIAGNYAATIGGPNGNKLDMQWLMNRGVDPTLLSIDPLARSYDGLLQTLVNSGWSRNRTLRIANYDWRLVPGPSDGQYDGVVQGLTAESLADTSYRYGVDYLGRTLRELDEFWRDEYGVPLDAVDVIAHSTGGLVTRTYLQSTAYGGVYSSANGAKLPRVAHFFSVGVPHRGASKAWNPLHDNWVIDPSFQVVLSKIANRAFQKVWYGTWTQANISGPDYAITRADLAGPNGERRYQEFVRRYIPTINTLLATYPFLDRGSGELETANEGTYANHLVLDLNNGADLDSSRDGNVFLEQTKLVAIAGIHLGEGTPTTVRQRFGPADDAIAPLAEFEANDAEPGELFFEDVRVDEGGDGTVPLRSATGFFAADPRATVFIAYEGINTGASAGHIKLTDNPEVQRLILTTLGAEARPENLVALGRNDIDNVTSIILDPVQGYLVDGQGRRLGWSEAGGPQEEIPNSIWYGDGDGFGVIYGPVEGPLRLELRGLDEPYYAQVTRRTADGQQGGVTLEGPLLGRGETLSAPVVLRGETYQPLVQVGGPYTVAEGASVQVSATGEAGLSYAWDLDGDGTFETAGQGVSFSAAGVDGPATRTATVRGTLATGQSATSAAMVTVENLAPTASLSAPATGTVGQPFTLALTGASDAGGDPLSFAFDCGQGFGAAGGATSASCTPTAAGSLTVRASVADDDGGANTYSATVTVSAAPATGQPSPALCYANGAQTWQDFAQGRQKNGKAVPASRSNPALALGLPQRNDTVNFVSLGFGGALTIRFANPLVNDGTSKADLRIWETSFGDANRLWSRYPEAARIEVSLDGQTWTAIGRTSDKDQAYDLVLPRAQFVRLTDSSDPRRFGATDDGFDLDAIEALTGCVRP